MLCQGEASEARRGEARLINKNENAACLDSCSAIPLAVLPDPACSPLSRTRTGPSKTQGRQPERDNDNVYMLITCENMQQTADEAATARQSAICHEVYFFTPTEITRARGREQRMRVPKPNPNLKQAPRQQRRHGLLLCVPFKVNLPARPSSVVLCVCVRAY